MSVRLVGLTAAAFVVAVSPGAVTAPNADGASQKALVYGRDGWIWRARVDASQRVRVTRGLYPEISPDGRWIAFGRRTRAPEVYELWVAALDGGARHLLRRARLRSYTWLPDSARLLIHDSDEGVLLADRSGRAATRLAQQSRPDAGAIYGISVAPDATFVVFDRRNTKGADVFAVPVAGGEERRLTVDGDSVDALAGPAGIAFTRFVDEPKPHAELWLMDPDGTNLRPLSQAAERPALWSANGRRLIAETIRVTFSGGWYGRIWTIDARTGAARPLYRRSIEGLHAAGLSRDGRRVLAVRGCVAFGTLGQLTPGQVETISADGGTPRILVRGACHASWNA